MTRYLVVSVETSQVKSGPTVTGRSQTHKGWYHSIVTSTKWPTRLNSELLKYFHMKSKFIDGVNLEFFSDKEIVNFYSYFLLGISEPTAGITGLPLSTFSQQQQICRFLSASSIRIRLRRFFTRTNFSILLRLFLNIFRSNRQPGRYPLQPTTVNSDNLAAKFRNWFYRHCAPESMEIFRKVSLSLGPVPGCLLDIVSWVIPVVWSKIDLNVEKSQTTKNS